MQDTLFSALRLFENLHNKLSKGNLEKCCSDSVWPEGATLTVNLFANQSLFYRYLHGFPQRSFFHLKFMTENSNTAFYLSPHKSNRIWNYVNTVYPSSSENICKFPL